VIAFHCCSAFQGTCQRGLNTGVLEVQLYGR
jgi:hypothetical protein